MRVSELQTLVFTWYDFNETYQELTYLLNRERQQLRCLDTAMNPLTAQDMQDTLTDLKVNHI